VTTWNNPDCTKGGFCLVAHVTWVDSKGVHHSAMMCIKCDTVYGGCQHDLAENEAARVEVEHCWCGNHFWLIAQDQHTMLVRCTECGETWRSTNLREPSILAHGTLLH
jgi:hypothetical protein